MWSRLTLMSLFRIVKGQRVGIDDPWAVLLQQQVYSSVDIVKCNK